MSRVEIPNSHFKIKNSISIKMDIEKSKIKTIEKKKHTQKKNGF